MIEIKAIIRPAKFDDVYRELRRNGYTSLTVYNGEGIGKHGDPVRETVGLDFPILHSRVTKMEMIVEDKDCDEVCAIIQKCACTGTRGDGIIYATPLSKVTSVRTGEENIPVQ